MIDALIGGSLTPVTVEKVKRTNDLDVTATQAHLLEDFRARGVVRSLEKGFGRNRNEVVAVEVA